MEEAIDAGHTKIEASDLLLSVLRTRCRASELLETAGLDPIRIRDAIRPSSVALAMSEGPTMVMAGSAQSVMDELRRRLGHPSDSVDLLMTLLANEQAASTLRDAGLDPDHLLRIVVREAKARG